MPIGTREKHLFLPYCSRIGNCFLAMGIYSIFWKIAFAYTFFLYLYHEPALNIFKKLLIKLPDMYNLNYYLTYLISPVLMLMFGLGMAWLWERWMPKTFAVFCGGRGLHRILPISQNN